MFAPLRFLWNATRGHRLRPWKSAYLCWRIETYSGLHADAIDARAFLRFLIAERYRLLHFLVWTAKIDHATRVRR